jgi:hypothetical protein
MTMRTAARAILIVALLLPIWAEAQPAKHAAPAPAANQPVAAATDENVGATRNELFRLLRTSPRLTQVLSRDASLLANQEYIERNNPQLAQFLQSHPEVARNPEFYLYAEGRGERLERVVWPEQRVGDEGRFERLINNALGPGLVFLIIVSALLWIFRTLLENRRWNRTVNLQTEAHNKLLDRLGTGDALLTYMQSDAGKRFLEAAPLPVSFQPAPPASTSPIARLLTPLQIGIVMALAGVAMLWARGYFKEEEPIAFFGTLGILVLMIGVGFIISAGASWALARHLGLLPPGPTNERRPELS